MAYGKEQDNCHVTTCFCTGECHSLGYCPSSGGPWEQATTYPNPWEYPWKPTVPEPWKQPVTPGPQGWVCPVCGRGNAPTTSTCPCYLNGNITTSQETQIW